MRCLPSLRLLLLVLLDSAVASARCIKTHNAIFMLLGGSWARSRSSLMGAKTFSLRTSREPARDFVAASAFVMVVTVMIPYSGVAVALIGSYSAGVRARLRSSQAAVGYMPRLEVRLHRQQQRSVLVSFALLATLYATSLLSQPVPSVILLGNLPRCESRRRTRLACSGS